MKQNLLCRMKPYIQPFERTLALAELSALAKTDAVPVDKHSDWPVTFTLTPAVEPAALAARLAYWEIIEESDRRHFTVQVLRERTFNGNRSSSAKSELPQLAFVDDLVLPNRRCLRYGPHGIHEYRGKFFPQLVRSLINIAGVPKTGMVADPMCGSGTTLVEALLGGHQALGLDMNPLSVFMARVKCSILSSDPHLLTSAYERIVGQLQRRRARRSRPLFYFRSLPSRDQEYLSQWFSHRVLQDLDEIARAIQESDSTARDFFWLALSNILRRVSWQKDDDLRVRKEVRPDEEVDSIRLFLDELGRSVRVVLSFLSQGEGACSSLFKIAEGDARNLAAVWRRWAGRIDAVITSPPYATALPYLDTDRLSLCYLGLLSRPEHRLKDNNMIGNREISEKQRKTYWYLFESIKQNLPHSVSSVIEEVNRLNSRIEVGFRRRNLPSLLAKYFVDMQQVFAAIVSVVRARGSAYVVIGNNHTIAGGRRIEIETSSLLVDIATQIGLKLEQRIPMEMLVSRDIFKRNAVASEEILCFRTPG